MPTSATVVIAGGGLTGCLTGLVLQRKFPQARIVILDQQSGEPRQDPRGLALALRTPRSARRVWCVARRIGQ